MNKEINNNILTLIYIFFALTSSFVLPSSFEDPFQTMLIFAIAFLIHLIIKEKYKKLIFALIIATITYLLLLPTINLVLIIYLIALYSFVLAFYFDLLLLKNDIQK